MVSVRPPSRRGKGRGRDEDGCPAIRRRRVLCPGRRADAGGATPARHCAVAPDRNRAGVVGYRAAGVRPGRAHQHRLARSSSRRPVLANLAAAASIVLTAAGLGLEARWTGLVVCCSMVLMQALTFAPDRRPTSPESTDGTASPWSGDRRVLAVMMLNVILHGLLFLVWSSDLSAGLLGTTPVTAPARKRLGRPRRGGQRGDPAGVAGPGADAGPSIWPAAGSTSSMLPGVSSPTARAAD